MESQYAPLSESCAKALGDKVYEKRKLASQEIEKCVNYALLLEICVCSNNDCLVPFKDGD